MPTIFTDAGALSPNEDVPLGAVAVTHVPQWKNKAGTRESEGVQRLGIISGNTPFSLKHVCVYRYIYIHIYIYEDDDADADDAHEGPVFPETVTEASGKPGPRPAGAVGEPNQVDGLGGFRV